MRIAKSPFDFARYSTVFLEVVRIGEDGKEVTSNGTAFLFSYEKESIQYRYIVTCQHVIAASDRVTLHFLDEKLTDGRTPARIPVTLQPTDKYFKHTDDLSIDIACCDLKRIENLLKDAGREPFYFLLHDGQIPDVDQLASFNSVEEVYFFGYPKGVFDKYNFTPIARRGVTASPFWERFDSRPYFVIDGMVHGGSSGSPVVLIDAHKAKQPNDGSSADELIFLGMISEGLRFHSNLYDSKGTPVQEDRFFEQTLGLGMAVRADQILSFLKQQV